MISPSPVLNDVPEAPVVPERRPAVTLNRMKMSLDAVTVGLSPKNGWVSHLEGCDVARFSTATRRFVALCHPDDIDHVLHAGRLNYYKSYEYELLRAILGVSLFTDEEDSWQRYRLMLSPMFAKRHLNGLVDLMIEPIDTVLTDYGSMRPSLTSCPATGPSPKKPAHTRNAGTGPTTCRSRMPIRHSGSTRPTTRGGSPGASGPSSWSRSSLGARCTPATRSRPPPARATAPPRGAEQIRMTCGALGPILGATPRSSCNEHHAGRRRDWRRRDSGRHD
jgi:hypothetical protein